MGAIFGGLITLVVLISLWGSRENKKYSAVPALPLGKALKATFNNRSFLTFAAANLFVQFTFTIILATIPFFAKYVLNAGPLETTQILASAFLFAIPMLFVWKRLTIRFGAKYCFMAAMAVMIIFLLPLFYASSFGSVLLLACLIGSGLAGFLFLADIILADIIDEDEVNTGTRREGMFFGTAAFINRFAIGLEAFCMSTVFILSGYTPYVFTQTRDFQAGLRLLIAGLPAIALVLAFAIMIWYPLAGKRLAAIQTRKGVI
jgi:GPH family glycoside/pentoside/hexuronide:cation symporter